MLIGFLSTGRFPLLQIRSPLRAWSAASLIAQSARRGTFAVLCQHHGISTDNSAQPTLLVVHPKQKSSALLQEALRLAESYAGAACPHIKAGPARHHSITPSTYFGPGVVQNIQDSCTAYEPSKVFVNAALTPVQQRNLEVAVGVPVLDRVGLIIDIFAQRARTREARLQVELASLEYRSSRLVRVLDTATGQRLGFGVDGATEVVSARERGRSGSTSGGLGGAGGGGQSEIQLQRQRVVARRKALQRKLSEVQRTREVQRAGRRRSGKPVLAVVGYTNAGKSSLLQALTRKDSGVEDRLFATLDPALRRVHLPSGREAILSDTVGFISDLPHQLVNAFKATLEEVCEADLLLHVLDASSPDVQQQRSAVLQVLRDLGISEARLQNSLVEVWNKTDLLPPCLAAAAVTDTDTAAAAEKLGPTDDDIPVGVPSDAAASDNTMQAESHTVQAAAQQPPLPRLPSAPLLEQDASGLPSGQQTAHPLMQQASLPQQASDIQPVQSHLPDQAAANQHSQQPHPEPQQAQEAPSMQQQQQHSGASEEPQSSTEAAAVSPVGLKQQTGESSGSAHQNAGPVAVFTSAVTGAGLKELLLQMEHKISVKCATRELADGTARLGPRLLTNTIIGPANKHRTARWRGLGEWESSLTQSLRDQSTSASCHLVPSLKPPLKSQQTRHAALVCW
ncbi:hypothetical protein ABBQ38_008890 [Trebouxia sp. C0009 RCD-2024]